MRANRPHRNLLAWQRSIDLVVELYGITKSFPRNEEFGLTSQIRRAGDSLFCSRSPFPFTFRLPQ